MRWSRLPVLLVLAGASCLAQIPDRKELVANPKFEEESPRPSFKVFTEAQLRAQIKIISGRSHAVFGYNTPEVRVKLPAVSNSHYAEIEFGPATLLSATGGKVPFELEQGGYQEDTFSDEIRFQPKGRGTIIGFARVRGRVKVKYPLAVKTAVIKPGQAGPPELAVKIDGPYVAVAVAVAEEEVKLSLVRAYDAAGRQLKRHGHAETATDDDGTYRWHIAFYGEVARLEIDTVESWAELDLPYNLTPAALLPKGHEGEDPESYQP